MTMRVLVLGLAASLMCAGCIFQSFAPTEILRTQVRALNDEARWGRSDLAAQRVAPRFRAAYLATHREWGRGAQIADTEVNTLVLGNEDMSATAVVEVSWYDLETMEVRSTVLRQRWIKTNDGFFLDSESVVEGDASLLRRRERDAS